MELESLLLLASLALLALLLTPAAADVLTGPPSRRSQTCSAHAKGARS